MLRSFGGISTSPKSPLAPSGGNGQGVHRARATHSPFVSTKENSVLVSVIVPVWKDAERLTDCLRALEAQTYPDHLYEVIVVDNEPLAEEAGSTTRVAQVVSLHPHAQLINERRPGSYLARNAGVSQARGEIIAFTDADCIPAPDWIEKGVAHLTAPEGECAVVAGRIKIFPRSPSQPNAVEQYEALVALAQESFVKKYNFGATANLFTFRKVFAELGDFLGEVKSGGDLEWGRRATAQGYKLEYSEGTCVFHPARSSFSELYAKIVRVTRGHRDLRNLKGRAYVEFDRSWVVDLVPPVRAMARVLREPSLVRWRDRVKVCYVLCFVRWVQAFEKSRLAFFSLWSHHAISR